MLNPHQQQMAEDYYDRLKLTVLGDRIDDASFGTIAEQMAAISLCGQHGRVFNPKTKTCRGQRVGAPPLCYSRDDPGPALMDEVVKLLNDSKKIQAIKYVRSVLGIGLKDAKDMVDGIEVAERLSRGL